MSLDSLVGLSLCLILAGVLGVGAQKLLRLRLGGLFVSVFLGFVGALLGREAQSRLGLYEPAKLSLSGGQSFPLMWGFIGALVATLVVAALASRKAKAKRK